MVQAYKGRHDFVVSALNGIPGFECRPGEGTFYALPLIRGALDARGVAGDVEFTELLLNEAEVAVVPGSAFGAPGYIRLSFACSMDQLEESLRRIKRAVAA
jgi:aspartate aminotransferase